jgi:glutamyl-tRNA reductase
MGKLTAVHLKGQGIQRMTIVSRTGAHAVGLARTLGAEWEPWEAMGPELASADIVITATGSDTPILTRSGIESSMRARRRRPLFLIDIAVPRDIEASCGEIDQVFLYNIDDLQSIVRESLSRRAAEVDRAERIVAQEAERFGGWLTSRGAIPTVVALRDRFERIRQSELQRLEPKLAGLPPEARARVEEITHLLVEKLLLTPTEQLKSIGDPETVVAYSDALNRLFSLGADGSDGAAAGPAEAARPESEATKGPLRA